MEYDGFGSVEGQLQLNSTLLEHVNYHDNKYLTWLDNKITVEYVLEILVKRRE